MTTTKLPAAGPAHTGSGTSTSTGSATALVRGQERFGFLQGVGVPGGLGGEGRGEPVGGSRVGGVVEHPADRGGDTGRAFAFADAPPGAEPQHPDGVVLLIA